MKAKILIIAALAFLAGKTFAQGIVYFSASPSSSPIKYSTDEFTYNPAPVGNPSMIPGLGQLNIAFYAAPAGTVLSYSAIALPDLSTWTQAGTIIHMIEPLAGAVPTTGITLPANVGAPGQSVELEIVGWTGTATSWTDAIAQGSVLGWAGSGFSGGALGWLQPTGTSTSPVTVVTGAGGFNGLVMAVPEPSTIALGVMGGAAFFLFRRRRVVESWRMGEGKESRWLGENSPRGIFAL